MKMILAVMMATLGVVGLTGCKHASRSKPKPGLVEDWMNTPGKRPTLIQGVSIPFVGAVYQFAFVQESKVGDSVLIQCSDAPALVNDSLRTKYEPALKDEESPMRGTIKTAGLDEITVIFDKPKERFCEAVEIVPQS